MGKQCRPTWRCSTPGAAGCEANYRTHQLLLAAEVARLQGSERSAMDLYARAIASAGEHGWVVLEALANELYARFWSGLQQRQLAKQFIREAYYQYRRWGAALKCRQLETSWPQEVFRVALQRPFGSKSLASASAHSASDMGSLLDLQSLLKANQLLAQEIQLDALLRQMFSVLLENAGAEQGGIVLLDDGRLIAETLGRAGSPTPCRDAPALQAAGRGREPAAGAADRVRATDAPDPGDEPTGRGPALRAQQLSAVAWPEVRALPAGDVPRSAGGPGLPGEHAAGGRVHAAAPADPGAAQLAGGDLTDPCPPGREPGEQGGAAHRGAAQDVRCATA